VNVISLSTLLGHSHRIVHAESTLILLGLFRMPTLQQPRLFFPRSQIRRVPLDDERPRLVGDRVEKDLVSRRVKTRLLDLKVESTRLEIFITSVETSLVDLVKLDLIKLAQKPRSSKAGFVGIRLGEKGKVRPVRARDTDEPGLYSHPMQRAIYPRTDSRQAIP